MTLATILDEIVDDPLELRSILIVVNVLVILGLLGWLLLGRSAKIKTPPNLEEYYDDEVLEGRRLERWLGWALLSVAVIALTLPGYWLREPARQSSADERFDESSIQRGATLFSAQGSEDFDEAVSLACATCHAGDGSGGGASYVITPAEPECLPAEGEEIDFDEQPECRPSQVTWSVPPLDTVFLRYPGEEGREQVKQVIVFGRPGTPMPAWGIEGGGAKNDQSIEDILNYVETLQITSDTARARAGKELEDLRSAPREAVTNAESDVEKAEAQLDEAESDEAAASAQAALTSARGQLANAKAWVARVEAASDGQLLFELNCARCHTAGWSYFDPLDPQSAPLPGPQGGGGTSGFSLRDGSQLDRFPDPARHVEFVAGGSLFQQPYGVGGIGTGRMPGFGQILSDEQIAAIVEYQRSL